MRYSSRIIGLAAPVSAPGMSTMQHARPAFAARTSSCFQLAIRTLRRQRRLSSRRCQPCEAAILITSTGAPSSPGPSQRQ